MKVGQRFLVHSTGEVKKFHNDTWGLLVGERELRRILHQVSFGLVLKSNVDEKIKDLTGSFDACISIDALNGLSSTSRQKTMRLLVSVLNKTDIWCFARLSSDAR